jgi:hypothetical protein
MRVSFQMEQKIFLEGAVLGITCMLISCVVGNLLFLLP